MASDLLILVDEAAEVVASLRIGDPQSLSEARVVVREQPDSVFGVVDDRCVGVRTRAAYFRSFRPALCRAALLDDNLRPRRELMQKSYNG
jgi:hypothetical protein